MKHKTKRIIALITATVMAANSCAVPLCSKPEFKAELIKKQVILQPLKPILPPSPQPVRTTTEAKKIVEPKPTIMTFRVTAYTAIDAGQRGDGVTASGKKAVPYYTVAASREYPFGTTLIDVETGAQYVVQDRGGAIKGNRLDLYIGHSNKKAADKFGVQYKQFEVILPH